MGDGQQVTLAPADETTLRGTFDVTADGSYQVRAIDRDGLATRDASDYFIRVLTDRPATVELVRPQGDREITALEEVVIEARAEDDYGLERFELVYGVVGRPERIIDLAGGDRTAAVTGRHIIYAEELELQAGDVISYYARAKDTSTSPAHGETRSDIYFLQVRPFGREFEEAQSQGAGGMQAADLRAVGRSAEGDRRRDLGSSMGNVRASVWPATSRLSADAQADLRLTAQVLAARMRRPAPAIRPRQGARCLGRMRSVWPWLPWVTPRRRCEPRQPTRPSPPR